VKKSPVQFLGLRAQNVCGHSDTCPAQGLKSLSVNQGVRITAGSEDLSDTGIDYGSCARRSASRVATWFQIDEKHSASGGGSRLF
jgi:hypothetical protein